MKKIFYMFMATGLLTFASCASSESAVEEETEEAAEEIEDAAEEVEDEIDR